jgi:quinolinate synthase
MTLRLPVIDPLPYPAEAVAGLQAEIRALARSHNAIILAHNYQRPEVQDVADFVGDSLGLSRRAAQVAEDVIVFCGVHFMAETAKVLAPTKTVLLPDLEAGCSLADTITADEVRGWRRQFPDYVAVGYVNTTAAVKAELDYCCTSGNVLDVIDAIPADKGILFLPDMFLGAHVRRMRPDRTVEVWMGECHVHAGIDIAALEQARAEHPGSEVLVHPECGCASRLLYRMADHDLAPEGIHIASTEGMINLTRTLSADTFIIATETGIFQMFIESCREIVFVEV